MNMNMTFAEETAAMRAKAGVRSITNAQLKALTDSTPTATPKTASDIYSNPPDSYRIALDEIARQKSNPSTPSPAPSVAPDGYRLALDKQRKEKK